MYGLPVQSAYVCLKFYFFPANPLWKVSWKQSHFQTIIYDKTEKNSGMLFVDRL